MNIGTYTPELGANIKAWLEARGMDSSVVEQLPAHGYVAWHEGTAIAAGFLRRCEGGFGILDSFVTNPEASPSLRNEAMEALVNQLEADAHSLGLRGLMAWSTDRNSIERTVRHGFVLSDFVLLTKSLR